MLTFTDDFSRYTTTYFIKSKSEVLSKFKEYVNSVEKQTGSQIMKLNILAEEDVKVLRSDNGGEYTSNNFTKFCAEMGISHKFTVPYCPQQNGVSERKNRTIMEKARSMLHQAKLPLEFWAEACRTAVYLLNRSPTTALKNETPFERLVGTKPDITHLKVFGCVSYVHVPNSKRRKLDAKARKAIFVGYPPGVKGYKLYNLEKKSFIVSRDVTFFEQNFDHFEEEIKSKEAVKLDLSNVFPKVDKESESAPEHSVKKEPVVPEHPESPVPKQPTNKEPAVPKHLEPSVQVEENSDATQGVEPPVQKNAESAVGVLSQYMSRPSKDHWIGVKRVLRYLKGTLNYGLKFSAHDEDPELTGYSDADWAGDIDTRRSTSGYVFQIGRSTVS